MKTFFVAILALLATSVAWADQPNLTVEGDLRLVFDEVIVVDPNIDDDLNNSQFNHKSPITVDVDVRKNRKVGEVAINATGVGNNADVVVDSDFVSLQGNQVGGVDLDVDVRRNKTSGGIDINATALGNNISVVTLDDIDLGNVQFNKKSPVSVDVDVVNNRIGGISPSAHDDDDDNDRHSNGRGRGHHDHGNGLGLGHGHGGDDVVTVDPVLNPIVDVTAVGNNLSVEGANINLGSVQLTRNSPVSVDVNILRNRGVGNVNVDATSIGNNLSVESNVQ